MSFSDNNRLHVFDAADGSIPAGIETTHPKFTKPWEVHVEAARWAEGFHDGRPWLSSASPGMDGNASMADVDGDRRQDVVVPTARDEVDGLGVHDLRTGLAKGWFPIGAALTRGPVASDLYGHGRLQLVVPVHAEDPGPNDHELDVGPRAGALKVIDTGARFDVAFSANLLPSDDKPPPRPRRSRPFGCPSSRRWPGPAGRARHARRPGAAPRGGLAAGALPWTLRRP